MRTIRDFDLQNKKVIIRVDFNVPIDDGIILDDNRIKESLDTINYAIKNNAKVILLSHLGRIKQPEDKEKNTLEPVSKKLGQYLNKNVIFIDETRGSKLEEAIAKMQPKDVLLVQNTRYEDLNDKAESNNNEQLGKYWASLGEIFINDAFGTAHRAHASNVGLATYLPSGIGLLLERELKTFEPLLIRPKTPFGLILGGSKVKDKIGLIENLIEKVDYILIGGGMAFTFLKASGLSVGQSIIDEENISFCQRLLNKYPNKIILPIDVVTGLDVNPDTPSKTCFISDITSEEKGLDIGPNTIKLFKQYLTETRTIFWNGPMGVFEIEKFSKGTEALCEVISQIEAITIVGGGDTASAVINLGYKDKFTHISTGGGAALELLEGKKLPALTVMEREEQ